MMTCQVILYAGVNVQTQRVSEIHSLSNVLEDSMISCINGQAGDNEDAKL